MKTADGIVEAEVRELVRLRGLDPADDPEDVMPALVDEVLSDYRARADASSLPRIDDVARIRKRVLDRVSGLGPLQEYLDDPEVEELWINGPGRVFVAKDGKNLRVGVQLGDQEVRDLVERMLRSSGRRLDLSVPFVDATLSDGSRLHVVIPSVTRRHWAVNIRRFVIKANDLDALVRLESLDAPAARWLAAAVRGGLNIVVSGGTQTGKTTMLNSLLSAVPAGERVVTCEEVFELQTDLSDLVAMQTRQANLEGKGEIDLRRLVIEALRMRPDRLIVGEVRQQEAFDLLIALNSGLPGMTSVHANSAREALSKLLTLPLLAGENVSHRFIAATVAATVDLVVHLGRRGSRRMLLEVAGVTGRVVHDEVESRSLWTRTETGLVRSTEALPETGRFIAAAADQAELE